MSNEHVPNRRPEPPFPAQHMGPPGLEGEMSPAPKFRAPAYSAAGKLEGKRALVTGGDSGIGRAVAYLFAREGADVAVTHLPAEEEDAVTTARAVEEEGRQSLILSCDVTEPGACERAVEQTVTKLGGLDILVNNAAFQNHVESIANLSFDQWEHTFRTNIHGYFLMAKAALTHLPRGGCIINTGSITGLEGSKGLLDYSATKGAIHAFTKSLAQQLVERGIRVNCVAPGPVWTPLNPAERDAEAMQSFGSSVPMERPAQPEEIAPAYVFFASNADSSYVTGEVMAQLGGSTRAG